MAKLYVFGIGGTGSRVLRSLTMLLAAGADANGYDIVPIVIDPDHANGNLTQTVSLMDEYVSIRDYLTFAGDNKNRFFSTKIDKVLTNFTMPVENTNDIRFRDFINLDGMNDKANQAMARMLFSDENLNSNMNVGFEGNPNIGSVVLNQITSSDAFLQFAQSFQANDRIFIISSIFGGTGASGFPLLLKTMRKDQSIPNHQAINNAVIGAITVLPYFMINQDNNSTIDSATFISKSKSALAYYDRTIARNNEINALYFIGDEGGESYENIKGGNGQINKAHAVELLSATAVLDFARNVFGRGEYMELGVKDTTGALTLNSFYDELSEMIRYPLTQFALFALGMKKDFDFLSSKQLRKNTDLGLDNNFYNNNSKPFVKMVKYFLQSYMEWLDEMKSNSISMDLFNTSSNNPFEFITGIRARRRLFGSYNWDTYRTALNDSKVSSTQAEDKFMEMYYNGLEELCKDKFNL